MVSGRLQGRYIAITGAAQGIGLAIARDFAAEGADLFLLDRDGDLLAGALETLRAAFPDRTLTVSVADITDQAGLSVAFATAARHRNLDGLVNNAGVNVFSDPLATRDEDWDRCFDINLKGAWNCCRAVLPGMLEKGHGVILNIASTHAFTIIPGTFPYPVAKHALIGLTKSLGIEYAGRGIRVNALAPGYVATQKAIDWWNATPDPDAARKATLALHPQGRIATPEEIARAAVFMISDECPFMTATCLTVDGGLSVRHHE